VLSTPDGEGRDEDRPTSLGRLAHKVCKRIGDGFFPMVAISVGRFDDDIVREWKRFGRTHDRILGPPDVSRERDRFRRGSDCEARGAEDVARPREARRDPGRRREVAGELHCVKLLKAGPCILFPVEGKGGAMLRVATVVRVPSGFLLEVTGVRQEDS